ncbi:MAG: lysylphosphatidylglycerol synthase transmembrane domain-containing protein [Candidatus Thorarchaeota archaeon]
MRDGQNNRGEDQTKEIVDGTPHAEQIEPVRNQMSYSSLALRGILAITALIILLVVFQEILLEINLSQITPILAAYTIFLFTVTFTLRSVRWKMILSNQGTEINLLDSTTMVFSAHFYNMLLPARTGETSRYYFLRRFGISLSAFGGSLLLEYILDFSLIVAIGIIVSLLLISSGLLTFQSITLLAISGIVLLVGVGMVMGINKLLKRGNRDISHTEQKHGIKSMIYEISNIRELLGKEKYQSLKLIGLSIPIWLGELSFMWFVASFTGFPITIEFALLAGAVGAVAQALPILPGSWGSYEIVVALAITAAGFPLGVGIMLAVLDHFFRYSFNLIAGFPFVTYLLGKK